MPTCCWVIIVRPTPSYLNRIPQPIIPRPVIPQPRTSIHPHTMTHAHCQQFSLLARLPAGEICWSTATDTNFFIPVMTVIQLWNNKCPRATVIHFNKFYYKVKYFGAYRHRKWFFIPVMAVIQLWNNKCPRATIIHFYEFSYKVKYFCAYTLQTPQMIFNQTLHQTLRYVPQSQTEITSAHGRPAYASNQCLPVVELL